MDSSCLIFTINIYIYIYIHRSQVPSQLYLSMDSSCFSLTVSPKTRLAGSLGRQCLRNGDPGGDQRLYGDQSMVCDFVAIATDWGCHGYLSGNKTIYVMWCYVHINIYIYIYIIKWLVMGKRRIFVVNQMEVSWNMGSPGPQTFDFPIVIPI